MKEEWGICRKIIKYLELIKIMSLIIIVCLFNWLTEFEYEIIIETVSYNKKCMIKQVTNFHEKQKMTIYLNKHQINKKQNIHQTNIKRNSQCSQNIGINSFLRVFTDVFIFRVVIRQDRQQTSFLLQFTRTQITLQKWRTLMTTAIFQLTSPLVLAPENAFTNGSVLKVANDSSNSTCVNSLFAITISDLVIELENLQHISDFKTQKRTVNYWSQQQINRLWDLVFQFGTDFDRVSIELQKDRTLVKKKFIALSKKNRNFGFIQRTN